MARFYGSVHGSRERATRLGGTESGLRVFAASWSGAVHTTLYDKDGVDWARVELVPWGGQGINKLLYEGPCGGKPTWAKKPHGQTRGLKHFATIKDVS